MRTISLYEFLHPRKCSFDALPEEQQIFVQENVTIESIIYRPNCTDNDSSNNGKISFKLIQGAQRVSGPTF